MITKPNDSTDTERIINGVKYVGVPATTVKDWRGFKVLSCEGCAGATCRKRSICIKLPNCRAYDRTDGKNLIFVAKTEDKTNG